MAKYREKPVEAFTFDEFIEFGKKHSDHIVNGMPWSFQFKGIEATHEEDHIYILDSFDFFTPDGILIIRKDGGYKIESEEFFKEQYEKL